MEVLKSGECRLIEYQEQLKRTRAKKHCWFTHLLVWWIAAIAAVACGATVIGALFMHIVFFAVRDSLYVLIESKK